MIKKLGWFIAGFCILYAANSPSPSPSPEEQARHKEKVRTRRILQECKADLEDWEDMFDPDLEAYKRPTPSPTADENTRKEFGRANEAHYPLPDSKADEDACLALRDHLGAQDDDVDTSSDLFFERGLMQPIRYDPKGLFQIAQVDGESWAFSTLQL